MPLVTRDFHDAPRGIDAPCGIDHRGAGGGLRPQPPWAVTMTTADDVAATLDDAKVAVAISNGRMSHQHNALALFQRKKRTSRGCVRAHSTCALAEDSTHAATFAAHAAWPHALVRPTIVWMAQPLSRDGEQGA
ncbi:MAG TPA: hypothetical protein VM580_05155 [Labilithrix sp.]|nr:hypothetical protein [Labilithrix sp.]